MSDQEGFIEDFSDLEINFEEDYSDLEIKKEYVSKEDFRKDSEVQKYSKILDNSRVIIAVVCLVIFLMGAVGVVKMTHDALIETNYGETLDEHYDPDKNATRSLFN